MNLFAKIAKGLGKTREALMDQIRVAVGGKTLDEDAFEQLEEILITADLGMTVSLELVERLRERSRKEPLAGDAVFEALAEELTSMMEGVTEAAEDGNSVARPHVTFVVGVNGSGKTTTIGKLAHRFSNSGEKVLIVAADTFRSAAVEQLEIWAERAGVDIVRGATGADPGSVVYDGLQAAVSRGVDRVLIDTAGRLHTRINLMKELEKLDRVAKKIIADAPHEVLLVIDGTTGQNGLAQARRFSEVSGVDALVVTKLDGTARGGVLVPIGIELGIPVKWIGLGEGLEDLVPFDPALVVQAVIKPLDNREQVTAAETSAETISNEAVLPGDQGESEEPPTESEELPESDFASLDPEVVGQTADFPVDEETVSTADEDVPKGGESGEQTEPVHSTETDEEPKKKRAWWKFGG